MAKEDKKETAPAIEPAVPAGIKAGAFLVSAETALKLSTKPGDFPGIQIVGGVKRTGTKSGKDWFAVALPGCSPDVLAKAKAV